MTKSFKGSKPISTATSKSISRASGAKSKGGKTATKVKATKPKPNSKVASKAKKATPTKAKVSTKVAPKAAPKATAKSSPAKVAAKPSVDKVVSKVDQKLPVFLGLSPKYSSAASARVHVIPVPYEHTTSYKQGTAQGPRAILEASQEVELFDDELWIEPFKIGVHTAEPVDMARVQSGESKPFQTLYETVKPLVDNDKFPLVLGGEHSLTLGAVRACAERYKDLSILQVDAHCDLRPAYEGDPYSHASISYRLYESLPNPLITQVGIRNVSWQEARWLETETPKVNIFWARMQDKWNFNEIVNTLSDNVYLTIDVDGLDSSIMPATGTPEPGGMNWYQLMELIKHVCVRKNVVGADIVELSPIAGLHAPDFLVAKLAYKLIGYRFALELGVTKKYV
jgi:agmatinase